MKSHKESHGKEQPKHGGPEGEVTTWRPGKDILEILYILPSMACLSTPSPLYGLSFLSLPPAWPVYPLPPPAWTVYSSPSSQQGLSFLSFLPAWPVYPLPPPAWPVYLPSVSFPSESGEMVWVRGLGWVRGVGVGWGPCLTKLGTWTPRPTWLSGRGVHTTTPTPPPTPHTPTPHTPTLRPLRKVHKFLIDSTLLKKYLTFQWLFTDRDCYVDQLSLKCQLKLY